MPYCRNCGTSINENDIYCPHCGARQIEEEPQTVFCVHCGTEVDAEFEVCPNCGARLKEAQPEKVKEEPRIRTETVYTNVPAGYLKNKWIAFLLCFFFGVLGAHKFYERKIGMGILYLFTAGLFGFGILFDLIAILLKPTEYYC